jgi:hypothetical protein
LFIDLHKKGDAKVYHYGNEHTTQIVPFIEHIKQENGNKIRYHRD